MNGKAIRRVLRKFAIASHGWPEQRFVSNGNLKRSASVRPLDGIIQFGHCSQVHGGMPITAGREGVLAVPPDCKFAQQKIGARASLVRCTQCVNCIWGARCVSATNAGENNEQMKEGLKRGGWPSRTSARAAEGGVQYKEAPGGQANASFASLLRQV